MNFHDIIYAMTDNQRLIQIINNLREQMYRYRLEYVKDARAHSILISEHKDIIDKLSKKDEENTKIVIRQHITNQERVLSDFLTNNTKVTWRLAVFASLC